MARVGAGQAGYLRSNSFLSICAIGPVSGDGPTEPGALRGEAAASARVSARIVRPAVLRGGLLDPRDSRFVERVERDGRVLYEFQ